MFQSLWNVAAAFCVHEETIAVIHDYHFGHHQNTLCSSEPQFDSHQTASEIANTLDVEEDHQDHLPSMTHLILEQQQHSFIPLLFSLAVAPKYAWRNDYRSPDLNAQTPPPEFSPLMVG